MPISKAMVVNIKNAMEKAGITTHEELAKKAGLRRPTITDLLNGKRKQVWVSTLVKIARACKCTLSELTGE